MGRQRNCFWLSLIRLTADAYYGGLSGHAGGLVVHQTVLQVHQVGGALFILAVSFCSSLGLLSSLDLQSGQDEFVTMGKTDGSKAELMDQWAGLMDQWAGLGVNGQN